MLSSKPVSNAISWSTNHVLTTNKFEDWAKTLHSIDYRITAEKRACLSRHCYTFVNRYLPLSYITESVRQKYSQERRLRKILHTFFVMYGPRTFHVQFTRFLPLEISEKKRDKKKYYIVSSSYFVFPSK